LLLYSPEALQFLQSAETGAGLPLHLRIQELIGFGGAVRNSKNCKILFLQNLVNPSSGWPAKLELTENSKSSGCDE
jgi:hypothetical protein